MLFVISVSWLLFAQIFSAGCAFLGISAERDSPETCLTVRRYLK